MVGLLFKEVIKVGGIFKTQTVADLSDVPLGMLQQSLRFTGQPVKNVCGGSFTGGCPQGAVQMVDVTL